MNMAVAKSSKLTNFPIRVFLADDHPVVLMGARAALELSRVARVIGEARSTDEVLRELPSQQCDVLVTDLSMPNGSMPDGVEFIRTIRQTHPLLPIVVMTMMGNAGILSQLLTLGILGLVDKADDMESLPVAVRSAAARRLFVSFELRSLLDAHQGGQKKLSPRESEVVQLLASGQSVTQIAERLGRSLKTVSRQKMEAMHKLGLTSNAELFQYARANGMMP